MLNKLFNILIFGLLFSFVVEGMVISEVMFNPVFDENYNEWVEIYNDENQSINVSDMLICNESINAGFLDLNGTIYEENSFIIEAFEYFLITDGGSGSEVKTNYNISNISMFHTTSSSICSGLSNRGERITVGFTNETEQSFDYTDYINDEGYASFFNNIYFAGCILHGTPGYYEPCVNTERTYELDYDFFVSNTSIKTFYGKITSPGNTRANLSIKIGERTSDEYDYKWVIFEEEIELFKGENNLSEILGNVAWTPGKYSNEYKAYSRLTSEFGEKRPSQIFKTSGEADVEISLELKKNISLYENLTLNFSVLSDSIYNISYGFKINNFITVEGKNEYEYICDKIVINKSSNMSCTWKVPEFIGNKTYQIVPIILFNYDDLKFYKQGERKAVEFFGLEDFGEPSLEIINYYNAGFGEFANVLVKYTSNNYNKNLSFLVYGYPKQVVSDYSFTGIKANDYEKSLVRIEVLRGKEYYVSVPFLTKPNCNNDYPNDNYRLRLRVFDDIKELMTQDFNIKINGINENLCQVNEVEKGGAKISGATTDSIERDYFIYGDAKFKLEIPEFITGTFDVRINISNMNQSTSFDIESYLYSGKRISKDNKVNIELKPYEKRSVELKNIIIEEKDNSKIIVKIKSPDRKTEKTISQEVKTNFLKLNYGEIKSFYTLQKKYNDVVKFFLDYEIENGTVELISDFGRKELPSNIKMIEEKMTPGLNNYFLVLKKGNKTVDVKELTIFSDGEELKVLSEINNIVVKTPTLLTANVIEPIVYELDLKSKKLINYLLVFIFITSIGILWRRLT